jgi:hypothetical protein
MQRENKNRNRRSRREKGGRVGIKRRSEHGGGDDDARYRVGQEHLLAG